MSNNNNDNILSCANCGKGEEKSINLKSCTACKLVKYCNRECQIAHRPQHKKECKKRAAELHEEALFKEHPPNEDCPICFLRMPSSNSGARYMSCCGKMICSGCIYEVENMNDAVICPFCRFARVRFEDNVESIIKRMKLGDPRAFFDYGCFHNTGEEGFPLDHSKALDFWRRAAKLGHAGANFNIGCAYNSGTTVDFDMKKAKHHWELAAMKGDETARHNLGCIEERENNMDRAVKHWILAAGSGENRSLKKIQGLYSTGHATKDDYAKALQAYQTYLEEIKSDKRDEAGATFENYRYY